MAHASSSSQSVQTHGAAYVAAQLPPYFQQICERRGILEHLHEESIDESSKTTFICLLEVDPSRHNDHDDIVFNIAKRTSKNFKIGETYEMSLAI